MKRLHHGSHVPVRGLRVFLLALTLIGAKEAAAAGRLLGSQFSPLRGMISADLDGDLKSDLATAGLRRRDSGGYLQEITVRLSSSELHTLTVRTASLADRLSVRDLDGDTDRDLVLESFDRQPLAILLNDGEGHFQLANLDRFRSLWPHSSPSLESSADGYVFPELSQGPPSPTGAPAMTGYRHNLGSARLVAAGSDRGVPDFYFHFSGRGPPAFRN